MADIRLPLRHIWAQDSAVVSHEAVDLTLDIGSLCPDAAAAGPDGDLVQKFPKQTMAAIVPGFERRIDLVCLVDCVDGSLHIPKTGHGQHCHSLWYVRD